MKIRMMMLAAAFVMAAQTAPLLAQGGGQTDPTQRRVTVKYEQADVRFVLKQLFDSVGVSYTLDPNVQGTVTVSLTDVPFTVALDNILRPLNLTYRVENGVYFVTVRQPEEVPVIDGQPVPQDEGVRLNLPEKIQLNYASPTLIAAMLGGTLIQYAQYELNSGGGGFGGGLGGFGGGFGGLGGFGGGLGGFGGGGFGGFGGGGFRGGGFGGGGFGGGGFGGGGLGGGFGGGFGR